MLLAAIVLAVLYFALMELLMLDAARELNEAQRFRARIVASALAENAAELAAGNIVPGGSLALRDSNAQGKMDATVRRVGQTFIIDGYGVTTGLITQTARVQVYGEVEGLNIRINYTMHSQ